MVGLGITPLPSRGGEITDFEAFIAENAPVTFTDPTVRYLNQNTLMNIDYPG